jgi:hypothetical protein
VELGAYDRTVIEWLAGWDLPRVAVVVTVFHRACAAGSIEIITFVVTHFG